MNHATLQNFIHLISTHTGLQVREQDIQAFGQKIDSRMKSLKLSTPEQYYQLLSAIDTQGFQTTETASAREWRELVLLLTIGETYFFRDQGQFDLLRDKILPELIELKQKLCSLGKEQKPTLRIWSAGCSTGEEAYSLAILVKELIPNLNEWNVFILGTDINPTSIEKAQRGFYDAWSFRQVTSKLQKQYFHQRKMRWEIDEQIRRMVKFRCSNFLQEQFPSSMSDIHSMDIIICRNVFIYFKAQAIATVLERFYHSLNPCGYLIVGHTELQGQNIGQLQPKVFSKSVVYQRNQNLQPEVCLPANLSAAKWLEGKSISSQENNTIKPQSGISRSLAFQDTALLKESVPRRSPVKSELATILLQAESLFHSGDYVGTIQVAEQIIQQHPQDFKSYYLLAQASANLGNYEQAIYWCQHAIKVDTSSEKPYYILASVAEERGDFEQAKTLFKKIIYLAPLSIAAYLELGFIYEKQGDHDRAKKMQKTALDLLEKLPPNVTIEPLNQITASELISQVKEILRDMSTK